MRFRFPRLYWVQYWRSDPARILKKLSLKPALLVGPGKDADLRISSDSFFLDFEAEELRFLNEETVLKCSPKKLCLVRDDALVWQKLELPGWKKLTLSISVFFVLLFISLSFHSIKKAPEAKCESFSQRAEREIIDLKKMIASNHYVQAKLLLQEVSSRKSNLCLEEKARLRGLRGSISGALLVYWISKENWEATENLLRNEQEFMLTSGAQRRLRIEARGWMWKAWKLEVRNPARSVEVSERLRLLCSRLEQFKLCEELPLWKG